jgi:hypothetical protein
MLADWLRLPHCDREQPWLKTDRLKPIAPVIFHRSLRYQNPDFPWHTVYEEFHNEAVFIGHHDEHRVFCSTVGPIPYVATPDFLELARLIAGCKPFCGNQSSPRALAEGLKVPVIVEVNTTYQNTHFQREGAIYGFGKELKVPSLCELENWYLKNHIRRAIGHTSLSEDALLSIARWAIETQDLPGNIAEYGDHGAGAAKIIATVCPNKTLHLFAAAKGWPHDETYFAGPSSREQHGAFESLPSYLDPCNCVFHGGTLTETSNRLHDDVRFSFVNIDCHSYRATKEAITFFEKRLGSGGLMVINNLGSSESPGIMQAIHEAGLPTENTVGQARYRKAKHAEFSAIA